MPTLTGLFESHEKAEAAVRALHEAGIPGSRISVIAGGANPEAVQEEHVAGDADVGAGAGALLGGIGGLLGGLGVIAIPGVGPAVAGGWLAMTAAGIITGAIFGVAAGGVVGALTRAGVPHDEAHVLAESIRRGDALITVRAEDSEAATVRATLHALGGLDLAGRRERLEQEGWTAFDPGAGATPPHA
jgi:hypothetical protein